MKKIVFLLSTIVLPLIVTTANAKGGCEDHDAPFIGINTNMDKCCIVANDVNGDKYYRMGDAKTTLANNKNFVIASCKATINAWEDIEFEPGRTNVDICHIGVKGEGRFDGQGGFTIDSEDSVINGNCKFAR